MATPASRLLTLLSLLHSRRDWPGALLAERLDVSHRTVRRDVDRLREMGYAVQATMGPDGGYRLDAGSELPPLLFDDDQVVALTIALQAAAITGAGIEEAALRALTTVRQVMPSRLRHRMDAVEFLSVPRAGDGPATSVSPAVLIAVSTAIRACEILRLDYEHHRESAPARELEPPRRVEPHHLIAVNKRWFMVAWDLDRADWRIFRADRITVRTPTGPRFQPRELPGGDPHVYVAARFKGSDDADAWPCTGTVVLHLPANTVLPLAGDGVVEDLGGGTCRYTTGAWSWVALAASLGRFDADIDVINPPELTEAFALLAARHAATAAR